MKWYTKAAEQGDAGAQNILGWMYENGKGVLPNSVEAYKWYNFAAAQSHKDAITARDYLITFMAPEQIVERQRLSKEFTPTIQK